MNERLYAVKLTTGGVRIVNLIAPDTTIEDEILKWPEQEQREVVSADPITRDQIPQEHRDLRDSWGADLKVDMANAKEQWKNFWRTARRPLLSQLDVELMRALEEGDTVKQSEIVSLKQSLRDVTKTDLTGIRTPEELKAIWPKALGEKES